MFFLLGELNSSNINVENDGKGYEVDDGVCSAFFLMGWMLS